MVCLVRKPWYNCLAILVKAGEWDSGRSLFYLNQKVELRLSVRNPQMQFTSQSGSIFGININVQSRATHQKGYLLYSHSCPHTSL